MLEESSEQSNISLKRLLGCKNFTRDYKSIKNISLFYFCLFVKLDSHHIYIHSLSFISPLYFPARKTLTIWVFVKSCYLYPRKRYRRTNLMSSPASSDSSSAGGFSLYHYYPNKGAAGAFVALFTISALAHLYKLFRYRVWYFLPFIIGLICASSFRIPKTLYSRYG